MLEIWKPLPENQNYQVSNFGNIKGPRGRILAGYIDKHGYHCVGIYDKQNHKAVKVHRAVASAFIGEIPPGMQVNHLNGVRNDNRLENLEITTASLNIKHSFRVLGKKPNVEKRAHGEKHHNSKLTAETVREIRELYRQGMKQTALAAKFGTPQTNISSIVRKESWKHVPD